MEFSLWDLIVTIDKTHTEFLDSMFMVFKQGKNWLF